MSGGVWEEEDGWTPSREQVTAELQLDGSRREVVSLTVERVGSVTDNMLVGVAGHKTRTITVWTAEALVSVNRYPARAFDRTIIQCVAGGTGGDPWAVCQRWAVDETLDMDDATRLARLLDDGHAPYQTHFEDL